MAPRSLLVRRDRPPTHPWAHTPLRCGKRGPYTPSDRTETFKGKGFHAA
ncbi:hypothetical protein [Acetobacter indonesiensis]|nr:hypothetical protein [Acetobacter indonesiensis]MCP1229982.1 hypothetical protein [Acetobacter indonesiensis]